MTPGTPSLAITKPISAWNKPLKADFGDLFKALSKGVIHGVTGQWAELSTDAVDGLSAIGLETDPGQLAWLLIRRALTQAIYDLVFESAHLIPGISDADPAGISDDLDLSLEQNDLRLDRTLFERPGDISVIGDIKAPFEQWLIHHGLTKAQANGVTGRLATYFVYALNHEWLQHAKLYAPVAAAVDTPFTKASEREQQWARYGAWLQRQVNEGMLDETFGLTEVYVPLRGYYTEQAKDGSAERIEPGIGEREKTKRVVVDLQDELHSWLERGDREDSVRLISGGPGCGKSSFAKMFAAALVGHARVRVLFVPLHQFDPTDDLIEAVGDFVRSTGVLTNNPLDPVSGEKKLLILFDGLDELAKQGKVAAEIAQQFVSEVQRVVERRNVTGTHLQVLISGRELAVQSNATQFRKPRQILHVLPYYVSEDERKQYDDRSKSLATDQRDAWWKKYGSATGKSYESMPEVLRNDELDEITAQPLLNYLVALTHERGKLDFSGDINLNVVYHDLLNAVHERAYAGHMHRAIQGMEFGPFVRVLEEIGLSAWHGDGRTTTVREIEEHCEGSGMSKLLDVFQEGAKAGVTRLLAAFYFRQHGQRRDGERTFEFTHKSFGEFLTARRIVRALRKIETELQRREDNPDDGWDRRQALKHWAEINGPTAIDDYLMRFLRNEVSIAESSEPEKWQKILTDLIAFMLRHGMPMELVGNRQSYHEESRRSRNAEVALLIAMNACARVTGQTSVVSWPESTDAGTWIRRLTGQHQGAGGEHRALSVLSHLDLTDCTMHTMDLYSADLSRVHAPGFRAIYALLADANLSEANLPDAQLMRANLRSANLDQANLERANLDEADLRNASLEGANLKGANLSETDLRDASLEGANLEGANLEGADLEGADLRNASFEGANLKRANLEGADLRNASVKGANLEGADLRNASLEGAKATETILEDSDH